MVSIVRREFSFRRKPWNVAKSS